MTEMEVNRHPDREENLTGDRQGLFGRTAKYLRELSVVVIGVAITFLAGGQLTNHREKKELRGHLQSVRTELETNLLTVQAEYEYYSKLLEFSRYLKSVGRENLDNHTVVEASRQDNGRSVMSRIYYYMPIESVAFEALRQSGTTKHIRRQDFWRAIMKSYKSLEELKHENDTYMGMKLNYVYDAMRDNQEMDIKAPAIYNFYSSDYNFNDVFDKTFSSIEEALSYF